MFYSLALFLNIFFGANQFTSNDHKSLNDSIRKYSETNSNKALDFGFEVLEAVDLDNPTRDLVGTYSLIGQVLTYKLLYAEALSYFSEALKVYELVPKSELIEQKPKSPPWLLINIGNLYYATGDIENAKLKFCFSILLVSKYLSYGFFRSNFITFFNGLTADHRIFDHGTTHV